MNRGYLIGAVLAVMVTGWASAQTGEMMATLAGRDSVLLPRARSFLAAAAGIVSPQDAVTATDGFLVSLGYRVPSGTAAATKGEVALLTMQLFGLTGDLRYEILPAPASAFRVLKSRGYFASWERPGQIIPGNDIIDLVHRLHVSEAGFPAVRPEEAPVERGVLRR